MSDAQPADKLEHHVAPEAAQKERVKRIKDIESALLEALKEVKPHCDGRYHARAVTAAEDAATFAVRAIMMGAPANPAPAPHLQKS